MAFILGAIGSIALGGLLLVALIFGTVFLVLLGSVLAVFLAWRIHRFRRSMRAHPQPNSVPSAIEGEYQVVRNDAGTTEPLESPRHSRQS